MIRTDSKQIDHDPLDRLTDVEISSPSDGQGLIYDATTGTWKNETLPGGGSGNSFVTIDCPAGTDPVADSTTDIIQLLTGGAMEITGDAAADSVTFKADMYRAVAVQSITAASQAITAMDGQAYRPISAAGAYTLTAEPTIAAGRNGQVILVKNVGSNNVILQDVNALGGSLLRLTASSLTIQPGGTMKLIYDSTIGFWIQQYLLNPQTFTPSISLFYSQLSLMREVGAASTLDTAPNFTIGYVGTPSYCEIDVSAGGDPSTLWPIVVPSPYTALNAETTPPTQQFYKATTINGMRVFTATATVAGIGGLTRVLAFTYVNNRFIGSNVKDKTSSLTEAEIEALVATLVDSLVGTFSTTGTNYIWYCYPSRLGTTIFFAIAGEPMLWNNCGLAVTVTNPSGYAETYQQWVSENTGLGAVLVAVTATLSDSNRIYMGPSTDAGPAISNANILALDDTADGESIVSDKVNRTYTAIKIEAGEYLWFCHPARIADLAAIKDGTTGFAIAGSYRTNVSHTNQYGYVETYRCWRSDNTGIYPGGENIVVT